MASKIQHFAEKQLKVTQKAEQFTNNAIPGSTAVFCVYSRTDDTDNTDFFERR